VTETPTARTVWTTNFPAVQAKIDKANRKAARLGLEARLTITVTGKRLVPVPRDGVPEALWTRAEVTDHTVTGDEVVLPGGWRFLAALDHAVPGANVVRKAPHLAEEILVPLWARTVTSKCDHCGQDRLRRDTYLVLNAENGVKQVGSTCLVDFLGLTPAQVGWIFEDHAAASERDEYDGLASVETVPLGTFLQVVAYLVRVDGWTSRGVAREYGRSATADDASNVFTSKDQKLVGDIFGALTDADEKIATDALTWVRSDDFDSTTDYGWNLRTACIDDGVTFRNLGIVASLIQAWLRHTEQVAKRAIKANVSVHVGTPGEKTTLDLIVTGTQTFDGIYGTTLLVKGATPAGAEVTCWTTPHTKFGQWAASVRGNGQPAAIKATVKEHGEFNGIAQTTITRASVLA